MSNGELIDWARVIDHIRRAGPITAAAALKECGYKPQNNAHKRLSALAAQKGHIELVKGRWQKPVINPSTQYIPQFKPLKTLDLWAGAMRPGCLDYQQVRSRVA